MRKKYDSGLKFATRLACYVAAFFLSYFLIWKFVYPFSFNLPATVFRFQRAVFANQIQLDNPRILIIGDSTVLTSLSATEIPNALSLAISGGSSAESYYALNKYLGAFAPPRCVLIGLSYNLEHYSEDQFWQTMVGEEFYDDREIAEVLETYSKLQETPRLGPIFPSLLPLYRWFYRSHLQYTDILTFQAGLWSAFGENPNQAAFETVAKKRGSWATPKGRKDRNGFIGETHYYLFQPFQPSKFVDAYLLKIAELLARHSIHMHFFQGALASTADTPASRSRDLALREHLARLLPDRTRVTIHGPRVVLPAEDFYNGTHPTREGSLAFTARALREIPDCIR